MVFFIAVVAAVFLGIGWVVQQRVAVRCPSSELLSWPLIKALISTPLWWVGIGVLAAGQTLSAWALQLGSVALVEAVLITCLLFAFGLSAALARRRLKWQELVGVLMLAAALGVFLAVANPKPGRALPTWQAMTIAAGVIGVAACVLMYSAKIAARRLFVALECALIAIASGAMYGLQDAATRSGIVSLQKQSFVHLLTLPWLYVMLAAATAGVLLSQSAFRAGRLDYALPPTAATQSIAGVGLGIGVMGDHLSFTPAGLATEIVCLAAMLAGVALIARSPVLGPHWHIPHTRRGSSAEVNRVAVRPMTIAGLRRRTAPLIRAASRR